MSSPSNKQGSCAAVGSVPPAEHMENSRRDKTQSCPFIFFCSFLARRRWRTSGGPTSFSLFTSQGHAHHFLANLPAPLPTCPPPPERPRVLQHTDWTMEPFVAVSRFNVISQQGGDSAAKCSVGPLGDRESACEVVRCWSRPVPGERDYFWRGRKKKKKHKNTHVENQTPGPSPSLSQFFILFRTQRWPASSPTHSCVSAVNAGITVVE